MKKALLFVGLLSAPYASIHCMDERQKLIEEHFKNKTQNDAPPPTYQTAYVPKPTKASAPSLDNINVEAGQGSINGVRAMVNNPNPHYNEILDPTDGTTYGQYWRANNIPQEEQYRRKNLLLEYVRQRQAQACAECCGRTSCYAVWTAVAAGVVTGCYYLCSYEYNYNWGDYDVDKPDFPGNGTSMFNTTLAKLHQN